MSKMIQIKDLTRSYQVNNDVLPILNGINCTIEQGEFVAILGPSGCGKSTFLNIIAGLDQANDGEIIYDQKSTKDFQDADWDHYRKYQVGIVFQNFQLVPHLTALENVELALNVSSMSKRKRRNRAKELLTRVGLKHRMKHKPNQLSGGQKQRVAIARALANHPDLLLADEPTGALDSKNTEEIMKLFQSLNQIEGMTILMVTHDENVASMATRNIYMLDGRIEKDILLQETESLPETCEKQKETMTKQTSRMRFVDTGLIAVRNIIVKRKRAILTVLGISVGIYSVMLMMGISNGIIDKVNYELKAIINPSLINISTEGKELSDLHDLEAKMKNYKEVNQLEEVYLLDGTIDYDSGFIKDSVCSYTDQSKKDDLILGAYPMNQGEITVTESIAKEMKEEGQMEDVIGRSVTIYVAYYREGSISYSVEKQCKVVGVTKTNLFGIGKNYITYGFAEEIAEESIKTNTIPQRLSMYLVDSKERASMIEVIKDEGFVVVSAEKIIHTIQAWMKAIRYFLLLIIGISLVVGIVMVVIVQYMSVTERTREIGILRAIGAGKQDIRNIFLAEAGLIGLAAGLLGVGVAGFLGDCINTALNEIMTTGAFHLYDIQNTVAVIGVIVSMLLCLAAGYFPARKAAAVDVIEVLRS